MLIGFDTKLLFGILSLLFSGYSYYIYYKSVFSGKSKPHIFSWFLWGFISIVVGLIQFTHGGGLGVANTLVVGLLCLGISILAYKKGDKDISLSDKIFLGMGLISVVLWIFIDIPFYSILILIVIDIFGFLPTFRKLYQKPYNEKVSAYLISACGYSFSILSLDEITFITAGYVICTTLFNVSLYLMVIGKRTFFKTNNIPESISVE